MTQRPRDPRFFRPLWTADQSRQIDATTVQTVGIEGHILMEHAGRGVAETCSKLRRGGPNDTALVLAGPGNNGGDGWVAARHLWAKGIPVLVATTVAPEELSGDAAQAARHFISACEHMNWNFPGANKPWILLGTANDVPRLLQDHKPFVLVDALLGIGLSRPVEGEMALLVDAVLHGLRGMRQRPRVLAVDVPTGMPADGSQPQGPFIPADVTVTFGGRNLCHAISPGCFHCGEIVDVDAGLLANVDNLAQAEAFALKTGANLLKELLPRPRRDAHKGNFGHVGVLVGAPGMQGASKLAAYAAHRASSGKVTLVAGTNLGSALGGELPETLTAELPPRPFEQAALFSSFSAFVVGPGMPENANEKVKAKELLKVAIGADLPAVVDAGALQALDDLAKDLPAPSPKGLLVCTPHPKEAAGILGLSTPQVQANRLAALKALCALPINDVCKVIWVLKGACPMVGEKESAAAVIPGGHAPLAVGGSGDVLAGLLGALMTRVPDPFLATVAGVYAHQQAGQLLHSSGPGSGYFAREIADAVQSVLFQPPKEVP